MANAADVFGVAFKNGSAVCLARIMDPSGVAITSGDLAAIAYTAYSLDPDDEDLRTPITGHIANAVTVANAIYDTLQTADAAWTVDTTGYNFRHELDVSTSPVFVVAGTDYLVEYTITPTAGQPIIVRFRVQAI